MPYRKTKLIASILIVIITMTIFIGCKAKEEVVAPTYEPGILTEDSFESEWLNIKFTLPEDARLLSRSDIDNAMNTSTEQVTESNIVEMIAIEGVGFPQVVLMVEKRPTTITNAADYIAALERDIVNAQLECETTAAKETVEIAGQSYTVLYASIVTQGSEMLQTYYCRVQEDKVVSIVLSCSKGTEEKAEKMIDGFSVIK